MGLSTYQHLLNKLRAAGITQVTLAGGEPTEHPDFLFVSSSKPRTSVVF